MNFKKGNSDLIFFIGFFFILFILWWAGGGASKGDTKNGPLFGIFKKSDSSSSAKADKSKDSVERKATKTILANETVSPFFGQVFISSLGTAKREYQPYKEYIVLSSGRKITKPINITGWYLTNGKDRLIIPSNVNAVVRGVSDKAYLPAGWVIYDGINAGNLRPILLSAGEKVVVNTGRPLDISPFKIVASFKPNVCTGYIESYPNYKFYPKLETKCPDPKIEPGINNLDTDCRKFIDKLNRCHTPEFQDYKKVNGERESWYVDNVGYLKSSCRDFLKEHYNYSGCVKYHLNDENFYRPEWRVYLNRPWEMWAKSNEVITLYDDYGRVVDRKEY